MFPLTTGLLTSPIQLVGQHQVSTQLVQSVEPLAAFFCTREAAYGVMCPPVLRKIGGFTETLPTDVAFQRFGLGVCANMHGYVKSVGCQ